MTDKQQNLVTPDDEHNRKLVDNVHPRDWVNPAPASRYHLVVIGAGTAGLVSAAGAAGLGAKVALIERQLMGGDCLNVGCVPSKGIIAAARAWHAARQAHDFGGPVTSDPGNFGAAMTRMRRIRADISPHDSAARFRDLGIDVFIGAGCFTGSNQIEVDGKQLSFRRAVIATGARASTPMIPGLENVTYLTNETIFTLTKLPSRLGIIGAGPIGSEMSQAFARLGSCVSLFEMTGHVLPREDPDAAEIVQKSMEADGIDLQLATNVIRVEQDGTKISVHFERLGEIYVQTFDQLLVTVGRAPNTENLGLEAAGIECGPEGVTINDRLQTTNSKVFACGDVASAHKFTHVADAQARIVIKNALFFGRSHSSELVVPWCTHTSPEIAHVGLYEQDALDLGYKVDTLTVPFSEVDRALLEGEEDGFLRVHLKKGSDRILGATMVATHAGDMIGELCLAITARVGFAKIAATIHPYPTQAEVIKKAADKWRRTKLTPTVKQLFEFWFRVFS
tara:strand:- start:3429 stop:4949 length:1521 start_codon:yes stop_codon:yes gene_type:complete